MFVSAFKESSCTAIVYWKKSVNGERKKYKATKNVVESGL